MNQPIQAPQTNNLPPEILAMMAGEQGAGQLPPELMAMMGGMSTNSEQMPMSKEEQFKQAYGMSDEDFSEYGFRKLIKEAQSKSRKNKLTQWQQEPSLQDLKHDFNFAKTSQAKFLAQLDRWQKLYDAPKYGGKEHKGSRVNPKLIRKQAEWSAPSLSEPFLSASNLYDVKPLTFEDADRARQNSLILNRQFNTQLNKVALVDGIIRQLVKYGNCVARMGWEYQEKQVKDKMPMFNYVPVPMEQAQQVMEQIEQIKQMQENEPNSYATLADDVKAGYEMSLEKGVPYIAEPAGYKEVMRNKVVVNKPTVQLCQLKNVYIDPTCKGDMDSAQFVIHCYESSLSELKKQGIYENIGYLMEHEENDTTHMDKPDTDGFTFQDKARKKIVVHEYWGYWDIHGTGETTSIVATWVGDTLIRMEENPFPNGKLPFVVFNYLPEEDSVWGLPNAELLGDNQEILGAITRGMIDLMGKSANSQTGYAKNFLDAANKLKFARGQDYEYNQGFDPRVHTHTHTFPEIPSSALTMVQMMNNEAESLSGVKAFSGTGINSSYLGDTATSARGVLDAVSKREMSILRRISDGFIKMGRFIMGMNAEFLSEKEVVRITNEEFVTIRRDDLAGEYDLTLTISTAEGDENKAQQLAFLMQTIGNSMGMGLTQMILSEIANLRKMPELAKAIENYQEQPDEMAMQMQQLQMAKLEAETAYLNAQAQEAMAKSEVQSAKVAVENARAESLQGDADNKALDFVQKDAGVHHAHDLAKQERINEGNVNRELMKQAGNITQQSAGHNQQLKSQLAQAELQQHFAPQVQSPNSAHAGYGKINRLQHGL